MARPKKSHEERLTEHVSFRVSSSDLVAAYEEAAQARMTLTDYARMRFLKGRVVLKKTRQLDHATFDQLRRIGVNLNQLAHRANREKRMPSFPALSSACASIEKIIMEILDDSGGQQKGP